MQPLILNGDAGEGPKEFNKLRDVVSFSQPANSDDCLNESVCGTGLVPVMFKQSTSAVVHRLARFYTRLPLPVIIVRMKNALNRLSLHFRFHKPSTVSSLFFYRL